jgi:PAS domain S-box-containing protein
MGAAIPGMHYTGMAAASFVGSPALSVAGLGVSPTTLGTVAITLTTVMVLGVAIAAAELAQYHQVRVQALVDRLTVRERQLEHGQAIAHVGSWEWDIPTNQVTWSAELYRMFGVSLSVPATYAEFVTRIHPDDRARVEQIITRGLAERRTIDYEWRLVRPDGEVRHVLARNVVVLGAAGTPVGLAGTSLDVTDRRRADEALSHSERYHRALTQQALDLVTLLDADAVIRYASPSHHTVLGYAGDALLGRRAFELIHPDDLETVARVFAEGTQAPGAMRTIEFRFRHADGSWRYLAAVGRNLLDDPVIRGAVINARDVTARRAAEEEQGRLVRVLQAALAEVKTLRGILPICANCKRVRTDTGAWEQIESYVRDHTDAEFSHGLCPACALQWERG